MLFRTAPTQKVISHLLITDATMLCNVSPSVFKTSHRPRANVELFMSKVHEKFNVLLSQVRLNAFGSSNTFYPSERLKIISRTNVDLHMWRTKLINLKRIVPAFSTGPPVSFTFAPPSSQFVVIWSQKTIAFGRLDETGIYVTKIFHKW